MKRKRIVSSKAQSVLSRLQSVLVSNVCDLVLDYFLTPYFHEGNVTKLSLEDIKAQYCFKQGTRLYVSDWSKQKILCFNEDRVSGTWGRSSSTELCNVYHGIVANCDEVFVTDFWNCRIQVFTPDGKFVRQWTTHANHYGDPPPPVAIALLNYEIFITTHHSSPCIQVYDTSGTFLRQWGTDGFDDGQCMHPCGLAVSETELVVADTFNDRIQIFDLQGQLLKIIPGLKRPCGVAWIEEGILVSYDDGLCILDRKSGDLLRQWFLPNKMVPFSLHVDGFYLFVCGRRSVYLYLGDRV